MNQSKLKRTRMCGSLRSNDIGQEVILNGWVAVERNLGHLIFIDLRDTSGISQVVIRREDEDLYKIAEGIKGEYVLAVRGVIQGRESKNPELDTGDIEVLANEIKILSKAKTPPIYTTDDDNANETMRLKYRYLDLRKKTNQDRLKLRSKVNKLIRNYLDDLDFVEVETPYLANPSPEGARDYLVPSRINKHKFYALPQSPQQMKQILMVSGVDKYYQIVRCFRDEDLRANRQPEFTQLDIEMSFVDEEDIMSTNENLIYEIFKEFKGIEVERPFKRMTYKEAMDRFGVDKPDLRFGFELKNLVDIFMDTDFKVLSSNLKAPNTIKGLSIGSYESEYSRKNIDALEDFVKDYGAHGLIWVRIKDGELVGSSIKKFLTEDNIKDLIEAFDVEKDGLIFIIAGEEEMVNHSLGNLRVHIANSLNVIDKDSLEILWITDFPLFEFDKEENRYTAKHHPFTQPHEDDIDKLTSDPKSCRARAYDLVINGDEIGGGSIRISNPETQDKMFEALGLNKEDIDTNFGYFVEALSYGTPPHGGIAYGLDRLMMVLSNTDNIRDVIAFPKTQSATDLLTQAPSRVDEDQLKELNIKLN